LGPVVEDITTEQLNKQMQTSTLDFLDNLEPSTKRLTMIKKIAPQRGSRQLPSRGHHDRVQSVTPSLEKPKDKLTNIRDISKTEDNTKKDKKKFQNLSITTPETHETNLDYQKDTNQNTEQPPSTSNIGVKRPPGGIGIGLMVGFDPSSITLRKTPPTDSNHENLKTEPPTPPPVGSRPPIEVKNETEGTTKETNETEEGKMNNNDKKRRKKDY